MNYFYKFLLVSISFYLISAPSALAGGLVPCGPGSESGSPCQVCDFITLAKNVVNFVIALSFTLGVGFIVFGGFLILTAESSDRVKNGWSAIKNAMLGIAIVLGAWLIVDTTLRVFMGTNSPTDWGPWNTFPACQSSTINSNANNANPSGTSANSSNSSNSSNTTIQMNGQTIEVDTENMLN